MQWVRKEIGPIASPDLIQFAPGLPKTRSGKIMRRILRKIAEDEAGNLGDTSTLADPTVVDDLVEEPAEQEGRRESRRGVADVTFGFHLTDVMSELDPGIHEAARQMRPYITAAFSERPHGSLGQARR